MHVLPILRPSQVVPWILALGLRKIPMKKVLPLPSTPNYPHIRLESRGSDTPATGANLVPLGPSPASPIKPRFSREDFAKAVVVQQRNDLGPFVHSVGKSIYAIQREISSTLVGDANSPGGRLRFWLHTELGKVVDLMHDAFRLRGDVVHDHMPILPSVVEQAAAVSCYGIKYGPWERCGGRFEAVTPGSLYLAVTAPVVDEQGNNRAQE
jgi:hypothetical protein